MHIFYYHPRMHCGTSMKDSCQSAPYLEWYIQAAKYALLRSVGRRGQSLTSSISLEVTCATRGVPSLVRLEPASTSTDSSSSTWDWLSTTSRVWRTGVSLLVRVALPQLVLGIVGGGIDGVMHALVASRSPMVAQVVLFEALPQLMAATSAMCFRNHGGLEYANATDLRSIDWLQHSQRQQRAFFPAHVHQQLFQGTISFQGTRASDVERNICHHLVQSQQHISRDASYSYTPVTFNGSTSDSCIIQCRLANLSTEPHFSRQALLKHFEDVRLEASTEHASLAIHLRTKVLRVVEEGGDDAAPRSLLLKTYKEGGSVPHVEHHYVDFLVRSVGAFSPPAGTAVALPPSKARTERFVRAMLQLEVLDPRGSHCEAVQSSFTLLGEHGSMLEVVPSAVLRADADRPDVVSRLVLFVPKAGLGYVEGAARGDGNDVQLNRTVAAEDVLHDSFPLQAATSFAFHYFHHNRTRVDEHRERYLHAVKERHACVAQDLTSRLHRVTLLMAPLVSCDSVPYQRLPCPVTPATERILVSNSAKCTHAILSAQRTFRQLMRRIRERV
jgi:hypothetical protein